MRNFIFVIASSLTLFLVAGVNAQRMDNKMSYSNAPSQISADPLLYLGNSQYPYRYHQGYYWYPHARKDILKGYNPSYDNNKKYWYASYMHPQMVYIDRMPVDYVYPHPLDEQLYHRQEAPMQKKWGSAPEMHSGRVY